MPFVSYINGEQQAVSLAPKPSDQLHELVTAMTRRSESANQKVEGHIVFRHFDRVEPDLPVAAVTIFPPPPLEVPDDG